MVFRLAGCVVMSAVEWWTCIASTGDASGSVAVGNTSVVMGRRRRSLTQEIGYPKLGRGQTSARSRWIGSEDAERASGSRRGP